MRYAKVVDGEVTDYPVSGTDVVRANPCTSFPRGELSVETMLAFGYEPVQDATPPAHDAATHIAVEGVPAKVDSAWVQTWTVRELTLAELAVRVPQEVPVLNALRAIDAAGLAAAYETWANDPARTFLERAFINRATAWRRDDPLLLAAATHLGLTAEQLDDLFVLAVGIA